MPDGELVNLIARFVANQIALADFSQRFASLYASVFQGNNVPRSAAQLCSKVIGPFAEFSRGHRSEQSLRTVLAEAIRPYARPSLVYGPLVEAKIGKPFVSADNSTESLLWAVEVV